MIVSSLAVPAATTETPRVMILFDEVSVGYGAATVLEDVSLKVVQDEIVCFIGASGCGKTTLLLVVAGFLTPTRGRVEVNGVPVTKPGPDRAMVFQDDAVFPWMTVGKNVEFGLQVKKAPPAERRQKAQEILHLVGLVGSERLYPRQLSGGMRKRVDLARALAVEPEILLMDEPYGSLDAMTKERLQVEFLRIHEDARAQEGRSLTALFVTHDLEEALFLGDRVAVIGTGPGHLSSILPVPFERPRPLELKLSSEFQNLRGVLSQRLEAAGIRRDGGKL